MGVVDNGKEKEGKERERREMSSEVNDAITLPLSPFYITKYKEESALSDHTATWVPGQRGSGRGEGRGLPSCP